MGKSKSLFKEVNVKGISDGEVIFYDCALWISMGTGRTIIHDHPFIKLVRGSSIRGVVKEKVICENNSTFEVLK